MPVLCRLADPDQYVVSTWNLADDPDTRAYWLNLFAGFPDNILKHLREDGLAVNGFEQRWARFRTDYETGMTRIAADARTLRTLHTIDLTRFRQGLLKQHDFPDPYLGVKQRENSLAAELFPRVIRQIDDLPRSQRWAPLLRGLLAGNMFDLGCPETIEMYRQGKLDFFTILDKVPQRPWFIDGVDVLLPRLQNPPSWKQALIFVDNAGTDIVLGVLPVARELARSGVRVVLAPNTEPALNDITLAELNPLLERLADDDPLLRQLLNDGQLATVGSGGETPLIDLSRISEACDAAAADSDLIVLEGMGRGVESNWVERFTCDVWRVALVKDHTVARWIGSQLFDAVCRFDPLEA